MSLVTEDSREEAVKVFVRMRPLSQREIESSRGGVIWEYNENSILEDSQTGTRVYAYDRCFGPTSSNRDVYEVVAKPVVTKVLEGYNATVLVYGETGSGKTWTMRGSSLDATADSSSSHVSGADPGWMTLCVRDILHYGANVSAVKGQQGSGVTTTRITLIVSYLEICNEEINDLLGTRSSSRNLRIIADDSSSSVGGKGVVIGNLVEEVVSSTDEFADLIARGEENRSYSCTELNPSSSDSHTICRLTVVAHKQYVMDQIPEEDDSASERSSGKDQKVGNAVAARQSFLHIVDLAGSERQQPKSAAGVGVSHLGGMGGSARDLNSLGKGSGGPDAACGGKDILVSGKGLLALGNVISKLSDSTRKSKGTAGKTIYIPYRDSKLTRILRNSLNGNSLVRVLCTISPVLRHREETVRTLKFGQQCKTITLRPSVAVDTPAIQQQTASLEDSGLVVKPSRAKRGDLKRATTVNVAGNDAHWNEERSKLSQNQNSSSSGGSIASPTNSSADFHELEVGSASGSNDLETMRLRRRILTLEKKLEEARYAEENRVATEEYNSHSKAELAKRIDQAEKEKQALQKERYKLLSDRAALEQKESNIAHLVTRLDERESKLMQMLTSQRDQEEQWKRCIVDLERKEGMVEDWERNHILREEKLMEKASQQEQRFAELNNMEEQLAAREETMKLSEADLLEREQQLTSRQHKLDAHEISNATLQEKLNQLEAILKVRERELELQDEDLRNRRKDLDVWETGLREKERKVAVEQKAIDEREAEQQAAQDRIRQKEIHLEEHLATARENEAKITESLSMHQQLLLEVQSKESSLVDQQQELYSKQEDFAVKESDLIKWEARLLRQQEQMNGIKQAEALLMERIKEHKTAEAEFFTVTMPRFKSQHEKELSEVEEAMMQQMQFLAKFQQEVEATRSELQSKCTMLEEFKAVLKDRDELIEKLRVKINEISSYDPSRKVKKKHSAASPQQRLRTTSNVSDEEVGSQSGSNVKVAGSSGRDEYSQQLVVAQRMLANIIERHDRHTYSNSSSPGTRHHDRHHQYHAGNKGHTISPPGHGSKGFSTDSGNKTTANSRSLSRINTSPDLRASQTAEALHSNRMHLQRSHDGSYGEDPHQSPRRHSSGPLPQSPVQHTPGSHQSKSAKHSNTSGKLKREHGSFNFSSTL